jgi:hypothetical protein
VSSETVMRALEQPGYMMSVRNASDDPPSMRRRMERPSGSLGAWIEY